ncbi:MAG TPA: isoprenyl transferase [Myxococcota bacterium]|nr:isoprenyl transferase [Myxococcota bacterium]
MSRLDPRKIPRHVAIIPDGNGRWAENRGLPRVAGYRNGAEIVREIVRGAHELGIQWLTFYAFSTENWKRPSEEIDAIMAYLEEYIVRDADELVRNGIRVDAIGRLSNLSPRIQAQLGDLIRRTESNDEMRLTFALSYGGRAEIVDAVRGIARAVEAGVLEPEAIDEKCVQANLYCKDMPDPDLLIRTGGEHRISNFLLWQLAYTEFFTSDALWPDFTKSKLVDAVCAFQQRERRFGRTSAQTQDDKP